MQLTKSKIYLSIALFMGILGTLFYIGIILYLLGV